MGCLFIQLQDGIAGQLTTNAITLLVDPGAASYQVVLQFLQRDAMRKHILCCRPVSVCHVGGLYPDG